MKCSDCRKPMDPVVALDIDGTMGRYHEHFIEFAEGWLGRNLLPWRAYTGEETFWQFLGLELPQYREIKLAYRQGGAKRTMPTYLGARTLARTLREEGCEVWICTTRPHLRLDNVDPDTREWLRRNEIPYDYMIYGDDKYQQLHKLTQAGRVIGVLEDLPEQFDEAEHLGLEPIMIKREHNLAYRRLCSGHGIHMNTAVNLKEARTMLQARVLAWRAQHHPE